MPAWISGKIPHPVNFRFAGALAGKGSSRGFKEPA